MATLRNFFTPRYDELTLYLHGVSFAMLVVMNADFRSFLLTLPNDVPKAIMLEAFIVVGAVLSIFNALIQRKKTEFEKLMMGMFVLFSNFFVSLYVLFPRWEAGNNPMGLSQYVALFNVLYTLLLITLSRAKLIEAASISDEDAPHLQVAMVTIPIVVAYLASQLIWNAAWYTTYSWCIFAGFITKDSLRYITTRVLFFRGTAANTQQHDAQDSIERTRRHDAE